MDDTALLDQFCIPTRYPNGVPSPAIPDETYTELQAKAALAATERVLGMVEAFLRQHTQALQVDDSTKDNDDPDRESRIAG